MKAAVSLPDDVFAEAEALRQTLGTSRSALYAAALRDYLSRHRPDSVTAALDAIYAETESDFDPALQAAAAQILERSEW
jgi:metal-responsive CopG/Arc/MetJ family transcriptional regulator